MVALSRLALNVATVREQWDLARCIEGCARHGIPGIAPWREGLAEYGLARAARHLRDAGLRVTSLCRAGMFTSGPAAIEETKRAIDEAHTIGAEFLVILAGGLPTGSKDLAAAREIAAQGLAAVVPHARAAGVKLAIEPLHPMTCADRCVISTVAQALDLAGTLGDGVGVALDVYHFWWDPAMEASIAAARGRIFGFHVCDWLVPTRDLVFDRGMMGDGIIDIPRIRALIERAGYDGMIDVEIFSARDWWVRDPDEVLTIIKQRFVSAV
jgi:sugar phosphate isomerase/epimerase